MLLAISVQAQLVIGWTDVNNPPADYYILYRSAHPDTGFIILDFVTPLEGTQEYMYYDSLLAEGIPQYYRVSAVRDLMASEFSPWCRGLYYDRSDGARLYFAYEYWPGMDKQNLLKVFTPVENCELIWQFRFTDDLVAVKCLPFSGTVAQPEVKPE